MDWSERMNGAIDYIEENLTEEISLSKAAEQAACSLYHFHRVFFAINEVTPADYVRRRRLTLAATELSCGTSSIIYVAVKYWYDSRNAFTRAFRQLHGVTPREAREPGVTLAAYPRISFHIQLKGGNAMDYQIIEKPSFEIIGKSIKVQLSNPEYKNKLRDFWNSYGPTQECQKLFKMGKTSRQITGAGIFGVALLIDGYFDPFRYAICIEKAEGMDSHGFKVHQVPAAAWAVFDCTAETEPEVITRVYREWFPSTGYEHDMKPGIEAYFVDHMDRPQPPDLRCQYWVPVIRKNS